MVHIILSAIYFLFFKVAAIDPHQTSSSPPTVKTAADIEAERRRQERMREALDRQYEMARATTRGRGLGFSM